MSNNNGNGLIKPAKQLQRWLRVVLYGPENSGKTWAALTFPKCIVFDTEDGSKLYAGSRDFSATLSQDINDLHAVIDYIEAHPGEFETLVIDSISILYSNAVASFTDNNGRVTYDKWAAIHTTFKAIYNRLAFVPAHVVVTAHEASRYKAENRSIERIGIKPDADDALLYFPDIIVRMLRPDPNKRVYSGWFEKVRGLALDRPGLKSNIDYPMFLAATAAADKQRAPETAAREAQGGEA